MRLWHYELIPYLPRKQLISQWRELIAIKGLIEKKGSPKSGLVDKVLNYGVYHYKWYTKLVAEEFEKRRYKYNKEKYNELMNWQNTKFKELIVRQTLFENWHNDRYLVQCYYNLQEKYDCGMIPESEWKNLDKYYRTKEGGAC